MVSTKKVELLSKEQERDLIKSAQSGNQKARSILMTHNQGLVHKIVQSFPLKNAQVTYDDLWQQGCIGFLHAVDMFELDRNLRLSTYAYRWIAAYIRRYYQNQGRVVRLPAHLADRKYQMDREAQRLTHEMGRTPSQEELEELIPGYRDMCKVFVSNLSLNKELESGEEVMDLQVADDNTDVTLHVNSLLDLLKQNVSDRDYQIFTMRYGVDGQFEMNLNEIGDHFGISRARAHQVTSHCLKTIKVLAD